MDRRRFTASLALLGLGLDQHAVAAKPERLLLQQNGWMPNNPVLPVLLYRGVMAADVRDRAGSMEAAFTRNGWPPQWRNGVYDFHHYHSTTHEVLGFAGGEADLILGGEGGRQVTVRAGDVALLPAGTGHCRVRASRDFSVVGAYPLGARWDICRSAPDTAQALRMREMALPAMDPVGGDRGAVTRYWRPEGR